MIPKNIEADLAQLPELGDFKALNARMKYGRAYRQETAKQKTLSDPVRIEATCTPPQTGRKEVVVLAAEVVNRRKKMLADLSSEALVIKAAGVELPPCQATITEVDFKAKKIKSQDRALAALAVLARQNKVLTIDMLKAALKLRFKKAVYEMALAIAEKVAA